MERRRWLFWFLSALAKETRKTAEFIVLWEGQCRVPKTPSKDGKNQKKNTYRNSHKITLADCENYVLCIRKKVHIHMFPSYLMDIGLLVARRCRVSSNGKCFCGDFQLSFFFRFVPGSYQLKCFSAHYLFNFFCCMCGNDDADCWWRSFLNSHFFFR